MSLPSGSAATWATTFAAASLISLLGYLLALSPQRAGARLPAMALGAGMAMHLVALLASVVDVADGAARLGFAPVLSMTVWIVLLAHAIESRLLPLPSVRRALAIAGALAVTLAWAFPGEPRPMSSAWGPLHFILGVLSYGLFGAAVLHAALMGAAERRLRERTPAPGQATIPLLRLERLTFRFVMAGFAVLSTTLVLGVVTTVRWHWDHKTVLSLLGWAVFAALLLGRWRWGWRGAQAARWLYAGAALLLLAYVGSRFVLEVLLHRAPT